MRFAMKRRLRAGFTLLEVMLATSIMAVGTMSVMIVIATAAGMASERQGKLRREQVVEEARHFAQTTVNQFRPGTLDTKVQQIGTRKGTTAPVAPVKLAPDPVKGKVSERYSGYLYDLDFKAKDQAVPEKGYDVTIVLHYGDDLKYDASASIVSTTIADEEFDSSETYKQEQQGIDKGKTRETR